MPQTSVVAAALLIGFVVFVTLKGQLSAYLSILFGPSVPSTTAQVSTTAQQLSQVQNTIAQGDAAALAAQQTACANYTSIVSMNSIAGCPSDCYEPDYANGTCIPLTAPAGALNSIPRVTVGGLGAD